MSEFSRINVGSAAVNEACHYVCDVSSDHAALQMFPEPPQSCTAERLIEMVRRSSSSGQSELVGRLGDDAEELMYVSNLLE